MNLFLPYTKYHILHTKSKTRGFTLIELLVVMGILGILTTIVASSYRSSLQKTHDSGRKSDLSNIAKSLEVYFNDKGKYPNSLSGDIVGCGAGDSQICNWGEELTDKVGTMYLAKTPSDSSPDRRYYYVTDASRQTYALYARLENDQDVDIPRDAAGENQFYSGSNCGLAFSGASSGCNYAISSASVTPESFFPLGTDTASPTPTPPPAATPTPTPTPTPPSCTVGTYYADADGDGYGAGSGNSMCPTAGYVADNTDCYDSNADAKPGSTYCGSVHRGDGSFDYNCAGGNQSCGTTYYSASFSTALQRWCTEEAGNSCGACGTCVVLQGTQATCGTTGYISGGSASCGAGSCGMGWGYTRGVSPGTQSCQ